MTGRVLPQDGGLKTLSGRLGAAGWGQIDIADPSSGVGLVSGSHLSHGRCPRRQRQLAQEVAQVVRQHIQFQPRLVAV